MKTNDPMLEAVKAAATAKPDARPNPAAEAEPDEQTETGVPADPEAPIETGVPADPEADEQIETGVPADSQPEDPDDNAPAPEVEPIVKRKRVRSAPPVKPVSKSSDIKLAGVVAKRRADKSKLTSDHQSAMDWLLRRR